MYWKQPLLFRRDFLQKYPLCIWRGKVKKDVRVFLCEFAVVYLPTWSPGKQYLPSGQVNAIISEQYILSHTVSCTKFRNYRQRPITSYKKRISFIGFMLKVPQERGIIQCRVWISGFKVHVTWKTHFEVFTELKIKVVENSHNCHQNPSKPDFFSLTISFYSCIIS